MTARNTPEYSLFQRQWVKLEAQAADLSQPDRTQASLYSFGGRELGWGVMALLDIKPARPGQTVVFPWMAVPEIQDVPQHTRAAVRQLGDTLAVHLKNVTGADRIVRHTEGYGVETHAHEILLPVDGRGDSIALHQERPMASPEEMAAAYGRFALGREMQELLDAQMTPLAEAALREGEPLLAHELYVR